jgi:hypothetical protein
LISVDPAERSGSGACTTPVLPTLSIAFVTNDHLGNRGRVQKVMD